MDKPRLSPAILLTQVENGYIAFDAAADRLHELNLVAALITELCDGTRSREEITALAAPFVPAGQAGEIGKWIDGAVDAGLLVLGDGPAQDGAMMDAQKLSELSSHLRDNGRVQPAYLCAKRVVELAPDDAAAWCAMAELAHIVGRRDDARLGFEKYLEHNPGDAEILHLLTALRDEAPPDRVPDECIQHIYKRFSAYYESNMVDTLDYQAPARIAELLDTVLTAKTGLEILDLGCGTGLSGLMLKPLAAHLTGMDLSPEMVEKARARNIYDRLDVAELTAWLAAEKTQYDLAVACDTLIYFGNLETVMRAVRPRLKEGGMFAFSVERGEGDGFRLTDSGRYVHSRRYIESAAAAAGLTLLRLNEGYLRMEYGSEVTGLFAALRK